MLYAVQIMQRFDFFVLYLNSIFFPRTINFRPAKARENKWWAKKAYFRAVGCAKINSARIAQILDSTEIYYVA